MNVMDALPGTIPCQDIKTFVRDYMHVISERFAAYIKHGVDNMGGCELIYQDDCMIAANFLDVSIILQA